MYVCADLALVAFLHASGKRWVKTIRQGSTTRFYFVRDADISSLVAYFIGPEGRDLRNLLKSHRTVRAAAGI